MKNSSKIFLAISLLWSITTIICCILIITVSTWTMMHYESYFLVSKWVIIQMLLSIFIIPFLFILLRDKRFPQRKKFYLITKRIQFIVTIVYILTILFEVNRYEHFIKLNSEDTYKSPSGKQIVPFSASVDEIAGRKIFTVMYQSDITGLDTLALRQEAMYVWQQVIINADKQNANFATVSAGSMSIGQNDSVSCTITIISLKDPSGSWKILNSVALPNQALKLTE